MTKPADLDLAVLVIQTVCADYNVKPGDLENHNRDMWFVWPRWVAIWLINKYTSMSLSTIGALFDRDHSTVFKIVRFSVPNETETNPTRKQQLFKTEARLLNLWRKPTRKAA